MSEKRLEIIKENVYMRSEIAKNSRLGIDTSLSEELELLKEIDRLNNIINELEKDSIAFKKLNAWIVNRHAPDLFHKMEIIDKLEELKDSD